MNLLAADTGPATLHARLSWGSSPAAIVSGSDACDRASRRFLVEVRDEQGHRFPLRDELLVMVNPPRAGGQWRAEADAIGPSIIGRGRTADDALRDWRKRFRMTVQRFLEMRPFESTPEDRDLRDRIWEVIDVPLYKASKPIVFRQIGKVLEKRSGRTVVRWEDGSREKVKPEVFDEPFARYQIGQPFEAIVTRHPISFHLIRADAVRRLSNQTASQERSNAIWERAVASESAGEDSSAPELDEGFWLAPPE